MSSQPLDRHSLASAAEAAAGLHNLLCPLQYEARRHYIRLRVRAARHLRRLALGEVAALLFENRDTMLFELYEQLRLLPAGDGERDELIASYHRRRPRPGELVATLFVTANARREREAMIDAFAGPASPVSLEVGPVRIRGDLLHPTRSPVQYVRFAVGESGACLDDGSRLRACLVSPSAALQVSIPRSTRTQLQIDLGLREADADPVFTDFRH